jgi:hypothetical protein
MGNHIPLSKGLCLVKLPEFFKIFESPVIRNVFNSKILVHALGIAKIFVEFFVVWDMKYVLEFCTSHKPIRNVI